MKKLEKKTHIAKELVLFSFSIFFKNWKSFVLIILASNKVSACHSFDMGWKLNNWIINKNHDVCETQNRVILTETARIHCTVKIGDKNVNLQIIEIVGIISYSKFIPQKQLSFTLETKYYTYLQQLYKHFMYFMNYASDYFFWGLILYPVVHNVLS